MFVYVFHMYNIMYVSLLFHFCPLAYLKGREEGGKNGRKEGRSARKGRVTESNGYDLGLVHECMGGDMPAAGHGGKAETSSSNFYTTL